MLDNMRVVVVTPAGRKRYLKVLFKYIEKLRPVIDEYRLWVNTTNQEDISFMQEYQRTHSDFVTLEYLPTNANVDGIKSIRHFFLNCVDENTIYVRFDDDITFIDTIEKFKAFLQFRKNNPQYFLVYANIINNAICGHIQQRAGAIDLSMGKITYDCLDRLGWETGSFTKHLHETVLSAVSTPNGIDKFRLANWLFWDHERVSINSISWLGSYFKKFDGVIEGYEEEFLSIDKPKQDNIFNIMYGDFLCVHYAFHTQRGAVDGDPTILERYSVLSECQ